MDDTGTHLYDPIWVFEYTQRPIPIPIRVLRLVSQPLVILDQAGRLENARNGWHMQTISNKQTCALSQFYDWLICRNLQWLTDDCCYHFLLVEGVRRDGGQDQYCAVFVSRGGWYQVTVSFRLPPLQPSPVSSVRAPMRAPREGDRSLERPLIIRCKQCCYSVVLILKTGLIRPDTQGRGTTPRCHPWQEDSTSTSSRT